MKAFDTTETAAAVHEEAQRGVGMAGRLRIALELSDLTHAFAVAGIRRDNAAFTDDQARCELARILYSHRRPK